MSTPKSDTERAPAPHPVARELKFAAIAPIDEKIRQAANRRLDMLTKPLGALGRLEHQRLACICNRVILMVAGLPLSLKAAEP
jgi:hypothetical protein